MNETQMLRIVEGYSRKDEPAEGQAKVIRVADYKTVYVEQIGENGRSIVMTEYKVDGRTYWAGYSSLTDTVFVSMAGRN